MKICLVAAFPPSKRQLNEYSWHIARELQRHDGVELTVLADELTDYDFCRDVKTDGSGQQSAQREKDSSEFNVIRCWKFGAVDTPVRLLSTIRRLNPDVVWFNLVFSSFGTPENPFAAFAGLSAPALVRAAGYYTHITLHHIIEHVDFSAAGVRRERLYRLGTDFATRALLRAHSVSVLLSAYRRTLMKKYSAQNVLVGTHGTFTTICSPPDFTKRNNPERRILAFGHWGTYKRLETLMEAFPLVLKRVPDARLIVAGGNHPAKAGYWESIRAAQPAHLPIEFRGYIPQRDVPEMFRSSSLLVMPYDSSTGSSGPAHQACEYGVPIVCADIPDFRCMAVDDDMAISFYRTGDVQDMADKLVAVLGSDELQYQMSEHNYHAGIQMTMASVVRNYLRWFELHQCKRALGGRRARAGKRRWLRSWGARLGKRPGTGWSLDADLLPQTADGVTLPEQVEPRAARLAAAEPAEAAPLRNSRAARQTADDDGFADAG
ncbi:MAG TPA: glycosyltransferase [Acidobacteriaceae bacterium]|nr:glycosyltransferase [Acidobacteriaceae bacterium]